MSNPGVVKLSKANVQNQKVWFDDNVGESIHFHMQDFRIDFTVAKFNTLVDQIYDVVDDLINIDGFSARDYDPVFLEQILIQKLLDLKEVRHDTIKISELKVPQIGWKRLFKKNIEITESRCVKALQGNEKYINIKRASDHINQTGKERLDKTLCSIKKNGYPYDNQYIVVFNNENIIRDGQHRAACLYHLYGDIEIPILRLFMQRPLNQRGIKGKIKKLRKLKPLCFSLLYQLYQKKKTATRKLHVLFYRIIRGKETNEIERIFKEQENN